MGTRHLTMVIDQEGQTKIAQYGQWDGYPDGQGSTVLEFASNKESMAALVAKLPSVKFMGDVEESELQEFITSIGSKDGWMTQDQSAKFKDRYPLLSRDIGGEILNRVIETDGVVFLRDSSDFAGDSLMCEWAYVIDLKARTFEVYEGFNKEPLAASERFATTERSREDSDYYQIKLSEKWELDNLPTEDAFLKAFEEAEAEE